MKNRAGGPPPPHRARPGLPLARLDGAVPAARQPLGPVGVRERAQPLQSRPQQEAAADLRHEAAVLEPEVRLERLASRAADREGDRDHARVTEHREHVGEDLSFLVPSSDEGVEVDLQHRVRVDGVEGVQLRGDGHPLHGVRVRGVEAEPALVELADRRLVGRSSHDAIDDPGVQQRLGARSQRLEGAVVGVLSRETRLLGGVEGEHALLEPLGARQASDHVLDGRHEHGGVLHAGLHEHGHRLRRLRERMHRHENPPLGRGEVGAVGDLEADLASPEAVS